jgi:hypothetical protein
MISSYVIRKIILPNDHRLHLTVTCFTYNKFKEMLCSFID